LVALLRGTVFTDLALFAMVAFNFILVIPIWTIFAAGFFAGAHAYILRKQTGRTLATFVLGIKTLPDWKCTFATVFTECRGK
jgi:hypothetical protein